jgi:predicted ATP-binding protein involved in virulence
MAEAAQELFPNAQIFAATHSPFVISSVNSGWIHILRMDDKGFVKADKPIRCSEGDSYLDAVEDVLGLTQWYDPETEGLLAEFRTLKIEVSRGVSSIQELEAKAKLIGSRSDALMEMMAREIHQVRKMLSEAQ